MKNHMDLTRSCRWYKLRPDGWTSSNAAGLPILPAIVRYDENQARRPRSCAAFHGQALARGPYSGVYCVYGALRAIGREGRLDDLICPEFVGSYSGSNAAELEQAARKFGVHAVTLNGLTADTLRVAHQPIILHVRPLVRSSGYTHWILFLGIEGGKARILDPPRAVESFSIADVLARWDGTGILISEKPATTVGVMSLARATFLGFAAIGALVVLVARL
jgi:hypothetical protein